MQPWVPPLLGAILLVFALGVFATMNLALRVPSRARMADRFRSAGRSEEWETFVVRRPQLLLATAVLRAAASIGLFFFILAFVDAVWHLKSIELSRTVSFFIALIGVLIFGVAMPSALARYRGEALVVGVLPVLYAIRKLCYPAIVLMELFDPFIRRLCGVPMRDAKAYADELEEELRSAVDEMERQGAVDEEEKEMIESVIELRNTLVEEIMTPRTEIVAVPKEADLDTIKDIIREKGHSRIPVYDETIDTIIGLVYAKDLLRRDYEEPFSLTRIMRSVSFIPETKHVRDLLHEFQENKVHIAVVLDEYGGTAGLVTIEDILEELVGEIADEYEPEEPAPLERIDEHTVEVDARIRIDDLNHELNIELPEDEDYETLGGFVFSTLGRIPGVGEECSHNNIAMKVVAAEPQRITRLRLSISPDNNNRKNLKSQE